MSAWNSTQWGAPGQASPSVGVPLSTIIYQAFRLANILKGAAYQASPDDQADAILALNSLLDRWANERLMVYQVARTLVNTVAGQSVYQIGVNAPDWPMSWPVRIERASIVLQSATPVPLELPMRWIETPGEWQGIPLKNTTSTFPLWYYYDRAYPLGNFNVWPVPQENDQIALYLWDTLAAFQSASDTVTLPPGYQRCLEFNLAVELMYRYPAEAVQNSLVIQEARDAKAWLKSINTSPLLSVPDSGVQARTAGRYDWRADTYR